MGFLDQLKGQAEAAVQKFAGEHPQLGQEVMNLVHSGPGGLNGLVQQFQAGGLGHLIQSWISTGPNQPATAQQIQQALGGDRLRQIATRVGLDPIVVAQKSRFGRPGDRQDVSQPPVRPIMARWPTSGASPTSPRRGAST